MSRTPKKYTPFNSHAPWSLKHVDNFYSKLDDAIRAPNIGYNYRYLCIKSLPDSTDKLFIVSESSSELQCVFNYYLMTDAAFHEFLNIVNEVPGLDSEYYSALYACANKLSYFEFDAERRAEYEERMRIAQIMQRRGYLPEW